MYTRTAGAVQPLVGSGTARHRRPYRSGIPGTDPPSVAAEKPRRAAPFSGAGLFCEPCFLPCPRASPRLPSLLSCAARKKEKEREREREKEKKKERKKERKRERKREREEREREKKERKDG